MNILLLILLSCLLGQGLFWGLVFNRWVQPKRKTQQVALEPVSVVICARNEAKNLQKHLPPILEQDYPDFEVWIVDDASTDASLTVLEDLQKQYAHLHIHSITEKKTKGKKAALIQGIAQAKKEWILLTDADCVPASPHWIRTMQQARRSKTEIVLGYGPYEKANTWLNRWVRLETQYTAIQYLSLAAWGLPYMGVGRNLMYQKSLFDPQLIANHQHLASGDDDLLINALANKENTETCLDELSFMYSQAPQTWGDLYRQKQRHYSTGTSYRWHHQLILGALAASHLGFWIVGIMMVFMGVSPMYLVWAVGLRWVLMELAWLSWQILLKDKKLFGLLWFFDIFAVLYYIIMTPALFWGNRSINWKE